MSASDLRAYFKSVIRDEISNCYEHKDAINIENVAMKTKGTSFHIIYQNTSNLDTNGDLITDNFNVTVTLFFNGYRDVTTVFDSSMDTAHNIKLRACNIANYTNGIKRVVGNNIDIAELDESNDNILKCVLSFDVRMDFDVI